MTRRCARSIPPVDSAMQTLVRSLQANVSFPHAMASFYDVPVTSIDGTPDLLGTLRGKVTLAVNVASRCGLTPQYAGLESLQRELADHNFAVVGFPCNQFGAQEPGTESQIQ